MSSLWQTMSPRHFAAFEGLLGQQTAEIDGFIWSRVRPLFYRPLLPFVELVPGAVKPPPLAFLGGFQHAVPSSADSNSFLDFLIFEDPKAYSLAQLDYNRKRQVKLASKEFQIRPIADPREFRADAYRVYRSFYDRTRYEYGSQRTQQAFFERWTDGLFKIPHVAILGGYRGGKLGGVSLSMLVGDTLFYATFFCDDASLRLFLSDLMLHSIREAASVQPEVKQIFAGMHKGGGGLDDFYLLRGCKVVRKPACSHLNPLAELILKSVLPREYARLCSGVAHEPKKAADFKPEGSVAPSPATTDP